MLTLFLSVSIVMLLSSVVLVVGRFSFRFADTVYCLLLSGVGFSLKGGLSPSLSLRALNGVSLRKGGSLRGGSPACMFDVTSFD